MPARSDCPRSSRHISGRICQLILRASRGEDGAANRAYRAVEWAAPNRGDTVCQGAAGLEPERRMGAVRDVRDDGVQEHASAADVATALLLARVCQSGPPADRRDRAV